jgi:hypothetical protein
VADEVPETHTDDLQRLQTVRGRRSGDRYIRIIQPFAEEFRREAPGHLVASEQVLRPSGPIGSTLDALRRVLIGRRIASAREIHERIGPI